MFCKRLGPRYKRITYLNVCWYIEELVQRHYTPGTISNHLSHLRTFYRLAGLPDRALHHYRVTLALRAVAITVRHTPTPKEGVSPAALKQAVASLPKDHSPTAVKQAILLMYMGFFRQSSITSATVHGFDPTRHVTLNDVWLTDKGLNVRMKWSKTIQKSCDLKVLLMPPTTDRTVCPVSIHADYMRVRPQTPPSAPYLIHQDLNPLTTRFISRVWAKAVKSAGLDPSALSLHSLRRGGASYTHNEGDAKLTDVMSQGTWRSLAVRDYIRPPQAQYNTVHHALKRL